MTEQQPRPWLPVAGHASGTGTFTDAPTPPGIPADQQAPSEAEEEDDQ